MATEHLDKLNEQIAKTILIAHKEVLTSDELAIYLGCSQQKVYNMTSKRLIPFSKPTNGSVYFQRKEIEQWLMSAKVPTQEQMLQEDIVKHLRK